MNFAEVEFWLILAAGLSLIVCARALGTQIFSFWNQLYDKAALLTLGLVLLLCVSALTFAVYLCVALGTFLGLKFLMTQRIGIQRFFLFVLVPLQLLPLFYFKYSEFLVKDMFLDKSGPFWQFAIPVGISFYTFQKVAFVVDTLHNRAPLPRFLDYMNFAGFFPQIVAGPIERRENLLPQMETFRFQWSRELFDDGVAWIIVGLFFKRCLADNLAAELDRSSLDNAWLIWVANVIFGLRIYYDFAGYSIIALGAAKCLGVSLTLNFESPYASRSIIEFWRRWHISLSHWFRDYVYVPMGGGRTRFWIVNVLTVFIVSGLWHGAGWNFVIWGAMHGSFLACNRLLGPRIRMPKGLAWLVTMATVFLSWLSFYETRTSVLFHKLMALLSTSGYGLRAMKEAALYFNTGRVMSLLPILMLVGITLVLEAISLRCFDKPYALLRRRGVLICLTILTTVLAPTTNNGFIYFAF